MFVIVVCLSLTHSYIYIYIYIVGTSTTQPTHARKNQQDNIYSVHNLIANMNELKGEKKKGLWGVGV